MSEASVRMQELEQKLETVFREIEQKRMRDMPMCNPALRVQTVGFQEWGSYYLGVMLTPWFMNLMLLPREPQTLAEASIGSKRMQVFPSGRYEFVVGEEAELGRYLVCSLFSPVFEFSDQATAVEVASMSLNGLMDETNRDTVSSRDQEIKRLWNGEEPAGDVITEAEPDAPTTMSRRDFLRGRVRGEEGRNAGD